MVPAGIKKLIKQARERNASDVHICVGAPILFRIGKDLVPLMESKVTAEFSERLATDLRPVLSAHLAAGGGATK